MAQGKLMQKRRQASAPSAKSGGVTSPVAIKITVTPPPPPPPPTTTTSTSASSETPRAASPATPPPRDQEARVLRHRRSLSSAAAPTSPLAARDAALLAALPSSPLACWEDVGRRLWVSADPLVGVAAGRPELPAGSHAFADVMQTFRSRDEGDSKPADCGDSPTTTAKAPTPRKSSLRPVAGFEPSHRRCRSCPTASPKAAKAVRWGHVAVVVGGPRQ